MLKTDHYESIPLPDADYRRARREVEAKALQRQLQRAEELDRDRRENLRPLLEVASMSDEDLAQEAEEDNARAHRFREESRRALVSPPVDYRPTEEQEIRLINAQADHGNAFGGLQPEHNLIWQGVDHRPDSWWRYRHWHGESEEEPWALVDVPASRFDARTRAAGEAAHIYEMSSQRMALSFGLIPPASGRLMIHTGIWVHGFYSINASDKWWNNRWAWVQLHSFVQVHQDFTRDPDYIELVDRDVYTISEDGRIDERAWHTYSTNIAAENLLWVHVGIWQYSACKGAGTYAELDMAEGSGNYCWVPYVQYFLYKN